MKIELVITRDPDSADEVDIYVDGVPVSQTDIQVMEFHVDAGAGYDWSDWVDNHADGVAQASPAVADLLTGIALDPPGDDYIDGMPDDDDERALEFDRAVRGFKQMYAKQDACPHLNTGARGWGVYMCHDCEKNVPWPVHAFEPERGGRDGYGHHCETCRRSREGGNHE